MGDEKSVKKTVVLTGASGGMGGAAFEELLNRRDAYDIVLLLRPSAKNKRAFAAYEGGKGPPVGQRGVVEHDGIKIVWGDLTRYEDVLEAVNGADYVLHPAALIPPEADHKPQLADAINVGAARNLVAAIKAQPDGGDHVRFVNVSSVALYGDRRPPVHMVRVGDPIQPSVFDFYAVTKAKAERIVVESGVRYWASIRQTYIAKPDVFELLGPIMYHQPLNTHLELCTARDSGYGLVQCLECPDDFYGRIYNMGGGPDCRFVFADYLAHMMGLMGLGDRSRILERDWFALRNFHCCWFEDSHVLHDYLGHWRDTLEDHYQQVLDAAPWYVGLGKLTPKALIKRLLMKRMALAKDGPLRWVRRRNDARVAAFFGSYDAFDGISGWEAPIEGVGAEARRIDHGYDEEKPLASLTLDDMKGAAEFRGGRCLSEAVGSIAEPLRWRCAFAHEFEASPRLVLKGGHWCPECLAPPWRYDQIAEKNSFLAQVYYAHHGRGEDNVYDEDCYLDIV